MEDVENDLREIKLNRRRQKRKLYIRMVVKESKAFRGPYSTNRNRDNYNNKREIGLMEDGR
jgi:hypothetical protein